VKQSQSIISAFAWMDRE